MLRVRECEIEREFFITFLVPSLYLTFRHFYFGCLCDTIKYRVGFGKNKTKIIVTGSEVDVNYYKDVKMWKMDGETVDVVDENEHLGLVVTGFNEEKRNVEENITKGRKSLFSLLGPAFSHQSLLNPAVQVHLFRLYSCPITRSGLSGLAIRPTQAQPLTTFHRKVLRSFLHFSERSPIPSLHFLLAFLIFSCLNALPVNTLGF